MPIMSTQLVALNALLTEVNKIKRRKGHLCDIRFQMYFPFSYQLAAKMSYNQSDSLGNCAFKYTHTLRVKRINLLLLLYLSRRS
jgi:hypothetical protein